MKRVVCLPPLIAAILFTLPQALENFQEPAESYVPVVYELLMLLFSYLAGLLVNGLVLLPLNWLVIRFWSGTVLSAVVFAVLTALTVDIVAYAFEIFGYQSSIFHPAYLYTIFLPLLALTLMNFLFLAHHLAGRVVTESTQDDTDPSGDNA